MPLTTLVCYNGTCLILGHRQYNSACSDKCRKKECNKERYNFFHVKRLFCYLKQRYKKHCKRCSVFVLLGNGIKLQNNFCCFIACAYNYHLTCTNDANGCFYAFSGSAVYFLTNHVVNSNFLSGFRWNNNVAVLV